MKSSKSALSFRLFREGTSRTLMDQYWEMLHYRHPSTPPPPSVDRQTTTKPAVRPLSLDYQQTTNRPLLVRLLLNGGPLEDHNETIRRPLRVGYHEMVRYTASGRPYLGRLGSTTIPPLPDHHQTNTRHLLFHKKRSIEFGTTILFPSVCPRPKNISLSLFSWYQYAYLNVSSLIKPSR